MKVFNVLILLFLLADNACGAEPGTNSAYSLAALQGGWWASCDAPAVEFYIQDDQYSGDFEGSYVLSLSGDVLTFNDGLVDGHSVNVTHMPLSFRIVELTGDMLVLRPLDAAFANGDWQLHACRENAQN